MREPDEPGAERQVSAPCFPGAKTRSGTYDWADPQGRLGPCKAVGRPPSWLPWTVNMPRSKKLIRVPGIMALLIQLSTVGALAQQGGKEMTRAIIVEEDIWMGEPH